MNNWKEAMSDNQYKYSPDDSKDKIKEKLILGLFDLRSITLLLKDAEHVQQTLNVKDFISYIDDNLENFIELLQQLWEKKN